MEVRFQRNASLKNAGVSGAMQGGGKPEARFRLRRAGSAEGAAGIVRKRSAPAGPAPRLVYHRPPAAGAADPESR